MSELRLSPEAEAELDGIWDYVARESGSVDITAGDYVVFHGIVGDGVVLILHVMHGRRDLSALLGS